MNRLLMWTLFWVTLIDVSCTQNDTPSANCPNATTFVKQVKSTKGQVYYDSSQRSYFIRVPNSFDSYDVGYTCNLPADYSKDGLQVLFDGSYYEYDKQVYGIAGNKYYYLVIKSIQ